MPLWLMALCAFFMALGTLMGGRRIIDTVGREMVSLGPREGLAADLGNIACLFTATLLGLPVSTTHTRTCALLGWAPPGEPPRLGYRRKNCPGLAAHLPRLHGHRLLDGAGVFGRIEKRLPP